MQNFWGITSFIDAFHVPKLLSQQLLPFGRSGDGLEGLTFEVEAFSALSVPRGRSAWTWRTVRVDLADGPRRACSSRVLRVLARLRFRSAVFSSFGWVKFRTVRVCRADNPRVPGRQSVCSPRTVCYTRCVSGGSVAFFGQSAAQAGRSAARVQTVRDTLPDSPRGPCGPSAPPGRTVRQSLAALFLGSIPSSFFRASACASRNRS
jgi:hypothetical protein